MDKLDITKESLLMDGGIPLYSQLVRIIKRNILAGILAPGDLLPSEAELCKELEISRSTVRQAIGALEADGLVVRQRGRGTFVAEPKMRRRTEHIYSFTADMNAAGVKPTSKLLSYEVVAPTPDIRKMLELRGDDEQVYRFTRVRLADGEPIMLETSFYPCYVYPTLTRELLETHSLYSLLHDVGIVPERAMDSYEAVRFSDAEAELLDCKKGSVGFFVQRRTRSGSGEVIEFTQLLMRGDRMKLDVEMHKDGVSFARVLGQQES